MIKSMLTRAIRLTEYSPSFFAVLAVTGLFAGFLSDELQQALGTAPASWMSRIAFAVSALALLPILVRDMNLWRLLAPKYGGIDELLSRMNATGGIADSMFLGTDGKLRIDALRLLASSSDIIRRTSFPASSSEQHAIAAQINNSAFAGSKYQQPIERKKQRNMSISGKHAASLALISDRLDTGRIVGLAGTVALSESGMFTYISGHVSDNDLDGEMVAAPGERVGGVLFFLVARNRSAGKSSSLDHAVLEDLIRASMVQFVLIALAIRDQSRFLVVAANSSKKMAKLFSRMHLKERKDFKSADQAIVFANDVYVKNRRAARRFLRSEFQQTARDLRI
jgi:hypothetical protein